MLTSASLLVVGEADTVAAAIAVAQQLRPDAVLLDVWLPDGNGIDLAHRFAALPWRPRVVLTSTDPDTVSAGAVAWSGAQAFVPKIDLPGAPLQSLLTAA